MTQINRTFTITEAGKKSSNYGWDTIIVHDLYPFISTLSRRHTPAFFWPIKNLFFPKGYWKDQPFRERLKTLNWPCLPGPKQLVHSLSFTATCDGEFHAQLDWDEFTEELAYELYKEASA